MITAYPHKYKFNELLESTKENFASKPLTLGLDFSYYILVVTRF